MPFAGKRAMILASLLFPRVYLFSIFPSFFSFIFFFRFDLLNFEPCPFSLFFGSDSSCTKPERTGLEGFFVECPPFFSFPGPF